MTRSLSPTMLGAIHASASGEVLVPLLKLSNSGWAAPLRLTPNLEAITHDGENYQPWAFLVQRPDDDDDAGAILRWRADNVAPDLITELRQTAGPITARIVWVLASQPDTIEQGPITTTLRAAEYDTTEISGAMQGSPIYEEEFLSIQMTPANYPGIFP